MEFVESFMKFSFPDDDVFLIEKDDLVTSHDGRKACECVVWLNEHVALIEAKSSTPNPRNEEDYNGFFEDIRDKFATSLVLFNDIRSHKFGEEAFCRLPVHLRQIPTEGGDYAIYLIVHGHQDDWMPGLQDTFKTIMHDVITRWNIRDTNVKALNHTSAKVLNLIVDYIPAEELTSFRDEKTNQILWEKVVHWFEYHQ